MNARLLLVLLLVLPFGCAKPGGTCNPADIVGIDNAYKAEVRLQCKEYSVLEECPALPHIEQERKARLGDACPQ